LLGYGGGPGCSSGVGWVSRAHGPERQKLTDGRPTADAEVAKLIAATAASDNATMKIIATNAVFFLFINSPILDIYIKSSIEIDAKIALVGNCVVSSKI
jgi:hypothetical protein